MTLFIREHFVAHLVGVLAERRRCSANGHVAASVAQGASGQFNPTEVRMRGRPDEVLLANLVGGVHLIESFELTGGNTRSVKSC